MLNRVKRFFSVRVISYATKLAQLEESQPSARVKLELTQDELRWIEENNPVMFQQIRDREHLANIIQYSGKMRYEVCPPNSWIGERYAIFVIGFFSWLHPFDND